jgi:predicted membrane protein
MEGILMNTQTLFLLLKALLNLFLGLCGIALAICYFAFMMKKIIEVWREGNYWKRKLKEERERRHD